MKVLALGLVALGALAGCENTGTGPSGVVGTTSARVRFVNAISGVNGSLLLTSNGTVVGTPQSFANGSATCVSVGSGNGRRLVFGTADPGGTAIVDSLGSLTTSLGAGGNYTIIATGTAADPRLLVLDNTATAATAGNANVRFVNATGTPVDFFATSGTALGIPTAANIAANAAGSFAVIPVTNSTLTFRNVGSTAPTFTSTGTFNAGQTYNVILLPNATSTGFQALTVARC